MNFSWTYPKQYKQETGGGGGPIISIMFTQVSYPCDNVEFALRSKT